MREILFKEGGTVGDVAGELDRTVSSVQARCTRMRYIRGRIGAPPNVYRRAEVMDMLAAGMSLSQIARILKVVVNVVRNVVLKLVRMGLVERTGGSTNQCRYIVTDKWTAEQPHIEIGQVDDDPEG